jgi:hypothetical protein
MSESGTLRRLWNVRSTEVIEGKADLAQAQPIYGYGRNLSIVAIAVAMARLIGRLFR